MKYLVQMVVLLAMALAMPPSALAVNPDEMLSDPVLEARARDISAELRCVVCQNQSIDDSDADIARDLRVIVRERLVAGDTDAEIRSFLVDRYGEFVLLRPRFAAHTLLLWLGPLLVFLGGAIGIYFLMRRKPLPAPPGAGLTAEEAERLKALRQRDVE